MSESEPRPNSCCICLASLQEDTTDRWTCQQCHSVTHLRCTLQWVLRQALSSTNANHFTCPVCRREYDISSLPGLDGTVRIRTTRSSPAIMGIISSLFSAAASDESPPSIPLPEGVEEVEEGEEENEEEDGDYEDESRPRQAIRINSREFKITVHHLTINYR